MSKKLEIIAYDLLRLTEEALEKACKSSEKEQELGRIDKKLTIFEKDNESDKFEKLAARINLEIPRMGIGGETVYKNIYLKLKKRVTKDIVVTYTENYLNALALYVHGKKYSEKFKKASEIAILPSAFNRIDLFYEHLKIALQALQPVWSKCNLDAEMRQQMVESLTRAYTKVYFGEFADTPPLINRPDPEIGQKMECSLCETDISPARKFQCKDCRLSCDVWSNKTEYWNKPPALSQILDFLENG